MRKFFPLLSGVVGPREGPHGFRGPKPWGLGEARPPTNPPGLTLLHARHPPAIGANPNKFGFTYVRPPPPSKQAPISNHHPVPAGYELSFTAPIPKLYHR